LPYPIVDKRTYADMASSGWRDAKYRSARYVLSQGIVRTVNPSPGEWG
jgi:hypothetical protein